MKVKTEKKCKQCKKIFKIYSTTDKFCTKGCLNEFEKGKRKIKREKKAMSVSSLTKIADKLWSQAVKIKGGYKCEYCGKTEYLNSHHLFGRARRATRWDINNGCCLCSGCHTMSSIFSAHQTSLDFFLWVEETKGREFIEELSSKSLTIHKVTTQSLLDIIAELKEITKESK